MKTLVHRAGYIYIKINGKEYPGENTIKVARFSLNKKAVNGVELDLQYTKDCIPVIIHDNVENLTLEEFKKRYPFHETLDKWIEWFLKEKQFEDKIIYLDIKKGKCLDSIEGLESLINRLSVLKNEIIFGSMNGNLVKKFSLLRAKGLHNYKVFLMVPEPLIPSLSLARIRKTYCLDSKAYIDGVHFYFIDSIFKEIFSVFFRRGDFVTFTDFFKKENSPIEDELIAYKKRILLPNLYLLQDIYYWKTGEFVEAAKRNGLETISASSGSVNSLRKMKKMGCDFLMLNVPNDAELL